MVIALVVIMLARRDAAKRYYDNYKRIRRMRNDVRRIMRLHVKHHPEEGIDFLEQPEKKDSGTD